MLDGVYTYTYKSQDIPRFTKYTLFEVSHKKSRCETNDKDKDKNNADLEIYKSVG